MTAVAGKSDADLAALAAAHGVATSYQDWRQREVEIDHDVIRAVLRLLDVPVDTPAEVRDALAAARRRRDTLPGTVVARPGQPWRPPAAAAHGPTTAFDPAGAAHRLTPGARLDLPLGWYRLVAGDAEATLVVAPTRLPEPPATWGWMLQLYALHSAASWGAGDLGDLREFVRWAADRGQPGLVLLNPLHAVATTPSVQSSPYSPTSRRFANPGYLSVRDTASYRRADPDLRARIDELRPTTGGDLIDYDAVWAAKRAALRALYDAAEPDPVPAADADLLDFATFRALAERHGSDWREWPAELRRPDHPAVAAARDALRAEVGFHAWLEIQCRDQLGAAQRTARDAGMPVGLVHDLAVGVDPGGADAWMNQDVIAAGVTAGAPPDAFNQLGQDWGLAAWRPDRLADTGYAAYRKVLGAVLANAGGIRVDHVMGLWRLWWVPPGGSPDQGTYVRYDGEAMLAILALEAHRAGAAVVAEDLGTVEPGVREALRAASMLGSEVLWFARDWDQPDQPFRRPADWPARAAASISTHDLPTAAGLLAGDDVRVRAELGLLGDVPAERARAERDRAALLSLLREEGLIGADEPVDAEVVLALHELLAASPCRFLLASPYDAVGETRQPNLPGTVEQYPNWRIPLPVSLEALRDHPRVREIASLLSKARPRQ